MSRFPTQAMIADAMLRGTIKAAENFLSWTNNRLFLSHGPHHIISIYVAQEIAALRDAPEIFIDATISDILRCSLPDREAYTGFMHKNRLARGTFSITLDERFDHKNDEDSISRVIMSINNGVRNAKLEYLNEIEVICKMLDCDTSLEYGVFGFYSDLSVTARKKLDKRIPEFIKSFDAVVDGFPALQSKYIGSDIQRIDESGEWAAGCYIIESI